MSRIKFVLWERHRAWWGAHQLNEQDPLLLDRMKEQEHIKNSREKQRKWNRLTDKEKAQIQAKRREPAEKRKELLERKRQDALDLQRLQEQDAEALEKYRKMAAGEIDASP
jgi:hypothetical protein